MGSTSAASEGCQGRVGLGREGRGWHSRAARTESRAGQGMAWHGTSWEARTHARSLRCRAAGIPGAGSESLRPTPAPPEAELPSIHRRSERSSCWQVQECHRPAHGRGTHFLSASQRPLKTPELALADGDGGRSLGMTQRRRRRPCPYDAPITCSSHLCISLPRLAPRLVSLCSRESTSTPSELTSVPDCPAPTRFPPAQSQSIA